MFNANELNLNLFNEIGSDAQLVIIPVNEEYGVLAIVRPMGGGKAACIAFSPATPLSNPLQGYRPTFLRKLVTTDFSLRTGRWTKLPLDRPGASTLLYSVNVLLREFEKLTPEAIREIDITRPSNTSSSPEISTQVYAASSTVPFEKALGHLMGVEFTMARAAAKAQAELAKAAAQAAQEAKAPEAPEAQPAPHIAADQAPQAESEHLRQA